MEADMPSDQTTTDNALDQSNLKVADDTSSLVSNGDMRNYLSSTKAQQAENSESVPAKDVDFNSHPITGYDNCGTNQNHYNDSASSSGLSPNQQAAERALHGPRQEPPENLSPQQTEESKNFLDGAKDFQQSQEQFGKDSDTLTFLDRADKSFEKMADSIDRLPNKERDGAIAAINKELEKEGRRIERVPETNDIYMGYIGNGHTNVGPRIKKGECPVS